MTSTSGRPSTPDGGRRSSPAEEAADQPVILVQAKVALAQEIIAALEMGDTNRLKRFEKGLKKTKGSLLQAVADGSPELVLKSLVHRAASRGLFETCKYLVKDLELDCNGIGELGTTPVIAAINGIISNSSAHKKNEHKRIVELLIRRGASPNDTTQDGFTPLHAATHRDLPDIAKLLLENGANVNAMCPHGTVLHIAAEIGTGDELVKLLFDNGVDSNAINMNGFAALHVAASKGTCAVARLILENKAEVDILCDKGTPLHIAAESGAGVAFVDLLLDYGANPNISNQSGFTVLHLATVKGECDVVKLLLANGAKVNDACQKGTSLHLAAGRGDVKMLELLCQQLADTTLSDENGLRAIEVAASKGFRDSVETLFQHTAPLSEYADWSIDGIMLDVKNQNVAGRD